MCRLGVAECTQCTEEQNKPTGADERGNDEKRRPADVPDAPMASQPAPADVVSSLRVSQQDVDQAAGEGRVKVRQNWIRCSLLRDNTVSRNLGTPIVVSRSRNIACGETCLSMVE